MGLIAEPFKYKKAKRIDDISFGNQISELHKFSKAYDSQNIENYTFTVDLNKRAFSRNEELVKGFIRRGADEKQIEQAKEDDITSLVRFVVGKSREAGQGHFKDIPIIYLGLGRMFPIGETKEHAKISPISHLTSEEEQFLRKYHTDILGTAQIITPQLLTTTDGNQKASKNVIGGDTGTCMILI